MTSLHDRILLALRDHVSVAMAWDSNAIDLVEIEDGIATVRLSAVCQSCPASLPRLVAEIEHELRQQVPEVEIVEIVH